MNNKVIPASEKIDLSCDCRLPPLPPSQIRDLLQEWIADNPYHTRQQHIFAYELFKWLERRPSGGRE